jgi:hypothetical protein
MIPNPHRDAASKEFLDFAPALSKDESPHFNPGQNFVTITDPLRNK